MNNDPGGSGKVSFLCVPLHRRQVHFTDAFAWWDRPDEETGLFDVIIMDIVDPTEAGPGIALYTQEFYQSVKRKLRPGGVFATQAGPAGLLNHRDCFTAIHATLATVFDHVLPYAAEVPSLGSK
jgi:spermidine synthase